MAGHFWKNRVPPVGANLLAKGPVYPTSPQTDTPPSRASSLPHSVFSGHKIHIQHSPHVGASLLAMRPAHPTFLPTEAPPSRAGSLPHSIFSGHKIYAQNRAPTGGTRPPQEPAPQKTALHRTNHTISPTGLRLVQRLIRSEQKLRKLTIRPIQPSSDANTHRHGRSSLGHRR